MKRIIMVDRTTPSSGPSRRCEDPSCNKITREGKPFCTTHVLKIPRARSVLAQWEEAEAEVVRVTEQGVEAVNLDGLIVEEILAALDGKKLTFRRLVKDHVVHLRDNKASDHYLTALSEAGLVDVEENTRKSAVVFLTDKGLRATRRG